jgi:DNA helicase-2/ATP-dependent DNA helicase PcrA
MNWETPMLSEVRFRPEQQAIVEGYEGGLLGIAAVPGSGKTFTLAHLAARLVETLTAHACLAAWSAGNIIVTFTNTAVTASAARSRPFAQEAAAAYVATR